MTSHASPSRRDFLKAAAILPFAAGLARAAEAPAGVSPAEGPIKRVGGTYLKLSLNAYSFGSRFMYSFGRVRPGGATLFDVADFCAKLNFDGFDATGYYFPNYPKAPADSYVNNLKRHAFEQGVGISGTGVQNNFTMADPASRAKDKEMIKAWIEVASRLGAPVIRLFADTQKRGENWTTVAAGHQRDDVEKWIADDLRECADYGRKFGVIIGVQNHGDFLKTGEEQLRLIKRVGSDWCGPIVDTGYYRTPDPYVDMALVAPYAVNWQVKQSPSADNHEIPIDLIRLMKIVRQAGYRGYLPIETLSIRGKPYDPYQVVPAFIKQVRDAIAATA